MIGNPQHERTRAFLQRVLDPTHVPEQAAENEAEPEAEERRRRSRLF